MPAVSVRFFLRNLLEFAAIFAVWGGVLALIAGGWLGQSALIGVVMATAAAKTVFFGVENIRQMRQASLENMPYHRFMALMTVNMWQIAASFALDFHALDLIKPESFAVINEGLSGATLVFEFFYFSSLNFMFFGYGDITPQTVPAKLITLTEVTLAFVTVIFLLSDFISMKDALRGPIGPDQNPREQSA